MRRSITQYFFAGVLGLVAMALLSACGQDQTEEPTERATTVTAVWPLTRQIERTEISVGRLDAASAPVVAAETAGRIQTIHRDAGDSVEVGDLLAVLDARTQTIAVDSASAEIRRLQALLDNQQVQVTRLRNLAQRQSISQDQLDEAVTMVEVYAAQLDEARSRLSEAEFNLQRTRIVSPVSGKIQRRLVSAGDFVSSGRSLFELVSPEVLRAVLPVPERLQDDLMIGQWVRLSVPSRPDEEVESRISEIRPMVGPASRAIELIVDLDNPGHWRPGGSVTGRVILEQRDSLVVPPGSVVRRPAGTVVFVVDGQERASQRQVRVGLRSSDWVEIVEGLSEEEAVVVDGAGFLSDGALLTIERWLDHDGEGES
jgi:RND family efflux transporter MFP subunit